MLFSISETNGKIVIFVSGLTFVKKKNCFNVTNNLVMEIKGMMAFLY